MSDQTIVRIEHCRQLRYCARGIRELFSRYGLDYADFLQNGIDADQLVTATNGDAMVLAAVEVARGRKQ